MNTILTSTFRTYLILLLVAGFFFNATSCTESDKASQTVKSKDVSTKKASDKKNKISNSKVNQNKAKQATKKQAAKNSKVKGAYWLDLQKALNLSNAQLRCMKTARNNYITKKKQLSKAKENPSALKKLSAEKAAKMKKCIGKDLYEKSRSFTVEWNKQRK